MRPLDPVYPIVLIDAIVPNIRDGQVANRPVYVAMGPASTANATYSACGRTHGSDGAKQWLSMLTVLRNRGIADVCIVCCD